MTTPGPEVITLNLPLRTVSLTNAREHWSTKAKRARTERNVAHYAWLLREGRGLYVGEGATITLTRVGPRKLDDDNLASSLKHVRDQVAAELGVDDGSPRLRWLYEQERGVYAVRVRVEIASEAPR